MVSPKGASGLCSAEAAAVLNRPAGLPNVGRWRLTGTEPIGPTMNLLRLMLLRRVNSDEVKMQPPYGG